mgnify:CR=1 FL=1
MRVSLRILAKIQRLNGGWSSTASENTRRRKEHKSKVILQDGLSYKCAGNFENGVLEREDKKSRHFEIKDSVNHFCFKDSVNRFRMALQTFEAKLRIHRVLLSVEYYFFIKVSPTSPRSSPRSKYMQIHPPSPSCSNEN